MKIKKICLLTVLLFFPKFLGASAQYQPLSSPERHELSSGWTFSIKKKQNGFFFKYALYFPEVSNTFINSEYEKIFIPGLSFGVSSFNIQKDRLFYEMCKKNTKSRFLPLSLGLKAKSSYYELIQPFGEFGLIQSQCYAKDFSRIDDSQKKFKYYLSYGVLLSFKILNKSDIYSLDQDYGINDIGFRAECLRYYLEDAKENSLPFCQLGLQISF